MAMDDAKAASFLSQVHRLTRNELIELAGYLAEHGRGIIGLKKRSAEAVVMLQDLIDGGEECRGMDSAISDVIRKLEGR